MSSSVLLILSFLILVLNNSAFNIKIKRLAFRSIDSTTIQKKKINRIKSASVDNSIESGVNWDLGPPPDLPSLLLSNRIIYIGMPIVPSVTEVVVAQLLFLNFQNPKSTITLYINSPGTNDPNKNSFFSFDNEAFAIADTMLYIKSPVRTICVGQAIGTAAMILSLGQKGNRYALPNASIMINQPKSRTRGQATDIAIKAKEILENRRITNRFLAQSCGKDIQTIEKDSNRAKYFSAEEAVEYGLIDKVLHSNKPEFQVNFRYNSQFAVL